MRPRSQSHPVCPDFTVLMRFNVEYVLQIMRLLIIDIILTIFLSLSHPKFNYFLQPYVLFLNFASL